MRKLILIIIIILLLCYICNKPVRNRIKYNKDNNIENYRDLPFIGNKDLTTYNRLNTEAYSRKNLPVYYPISSPLEDNYFNHINSITSPKLSMFRNVLNQVYLFTNQSVQPMTFNYTDRPIEQTTVDKQKVMQLANMIIDLINKFGDPLLKVKFIQTENEVTEQTEEQSRINFDIKLELNYADSENLGRNPQPDIMYIQIEYVFEKVYNDQFYSNNPQAPNQAPRPKIDFKTYLLKLIVIGAAHDGFIGGRYKENKIHANKN